MPKRTVDFSGKSFQQQMIDLTRGDKQKEPLPKEQPPKRGRGRPRKNPLPEPEPDPDELESSSEESSMEAVVPHTSSEDSDEQKKKINKIGIITDLRKKLNAVGTGLRPSVDCTMEQLDGEIDVLNSEINSRRGDAAVKQITLMLMPLIEKVVALSVPPQQFDVTGLQEEVHDNWEILDEACQHIAILHRDWFEISPYAEWCKGVYTCAFSRNMKNQMKRRMPQPENPPTEE